MAMHRLLTIAIFLSTISISAFVEAENHVMNSRKLDDQTPPALDNKCGNCPCDKPCNPPLSPPPPPPSSPPPPPKNPPTSTICPPPPSPPTSVPSGQKPPSSPYIYINGPPGSVYPVYPYYSSAERTFSMAVIPFLIGVLWILAF